MTWWGLLQDRSHLDDLVHVVSDALFEDDDEGPAFRWHSTERLSPDDDQLLGCAPDQVAFALLDNADAVVELIGKVRAQAAAAGLTGTSDVKRSVVEAHRAVRHLRLVNPVDHHHRHHPPPADGDTHH